MTAAAALDAQIKRYRQMTGEQRLALLWNYTKCPATLRVKTYAGSIQTPT